MPPLTPQQIDAAKDAEARVRLLIEAGQVLPTHLRGRILALGPEAIPPLLSLMEDEALSLETAPGEGWAPIHAVEMLAELRAEEAIPPMLRVLARTEWSAILHGEILKALPMLGPAALEPSLAAFEESQDPDLQRSLFHVLAGLKAHDERVFRILARLLEEDVEFGAMLLAEYGDARAVPLLSAALDEYQPKPSDDWMANHAVVELEAAIQHLDGTLTPEQKEKVRRILAPAEAQRLRLLAALGRATGRADLATSPVRGARSALAGAPAPRARSVATTPARAAAVRNTRSAAWERNEPASEPVGQHAAYC